MSSHTIKAPKKLIEVALPLDAINAASAREKSIRHGHPSTLHLWWARRPLAAARAVIFSQLVNDPSWKWEMEHPGEIPPGHLKASWAASRKRLFKIIEDLVLWENTTNEAVLERARAEIRKSWLEVCELNKDHLQASELFDPENMPGLHDPFAGGGAIPLEAQRLGLKAFASDLNPVAVLINKAMIEIPPKFAGMPPVNPEARSRTDAASGSWKGATGLAEDVRYYGDWVRKEAEKRIGHLYPPVKVTEEMAESRSDLKQYVGQQLTVIAWIWARTVKSPNPVFSHVDVPLASTFVLSSKKGREAFVEPIIDGANYRFKVNMGVPPTEAKTGTKLARGANFRCLLSETPISDDYIKAESMAGRIGSKLMAIVVQGKQGRFYLSASEGDGEAATTASPQWKPEQQMNRKTRDLVSGRGYGYFSWSDLHTSRQLLLLTTISDLVSDVRDSIERDSLVAGIAGNTLGASNNENCFARKYAQAVAIYLALGVGKVADAQTSFCRWKPSMDQSIATFGRQAIPMVWDYSEANPFGGMAGDYLVSLKNMAKVIDNFVPISDGVVQQKDAQTQSISKLKFVSTDPPYYDNIAYADLSDFFYTWLRRPIRSTFPDIFSTIAVPKDEELVAVSYRHGSKSNAEAFFLSGMTEAMLRISKQAHAASPITIYYAFKQSETKDGEGTLSPGWVTFLGAVNTAMLQVTGTWPIRTELANKVSGIGRNMLASSVVLVCRKRPDDASTTSRRAFIRELNRVLPDALDEMTKGSGDEQSPVAPVDLSQAIIGPGMAVFSKYSAVLEADGSAMSVKTALQLINRFLAEDDFDADTSFCLHWFEQYGWKDGIFGEADVLARAKGTSVDGVNAAGVIASGSGQVRLLKWADYPTDWDAAKDKRLPVWGALHQLIRVLKQGGESEGGLVLAAVADKAEAIRQLAYRLYTLCERKGWAEDARAYNELITSWTALESAAANAPKQRELFD